MGNDQLSIWVTVDRDAITTVADDVKRRRDPHLSAIPPPTNGLLRLFINRRRPELLAIGQVLRFMVPEELNPPVWVSRHQLIDQRNHSGTLWTLVD